VFLPLVFGLHTAVPVHWRNGVLVAASLVFYAWGEPVWVSLIVLSAFVDYNLGRAIAAEPREKRRIVYLAASLCVNLGLLVTFKYSGFFAQTLNGLGLSLPVVKLSLPVGISFYTFQTVSYVVEVSGDARGLRNAFSTTCFRFPVFPTRGGSIVRHPQIAAEIERRTVTWEAVAQGLFRFVIGLFKKVMVANEAGAWLRCFWTEMPLPPRVGRLDRSDPVFPAGFYYDFSGYSRHGDWHGKKMLAFLCPKFRLSLHVAFRKGILAPLHMSLGSFFRDFYTFPWEATGAVRANVLSCGF
jgi:alginate O-acetyltransferase complex protein AlgI